MVRDRMGSYLSLCDLSNVVKSGSAGKRSCAVMCLCCVAREKFITASCIETVDGACLIGLGTVASVAGMVVWYRVPCI